MQEHQLERLEARRLIRRRQQLLQLLKLRRHVHKRRGKRSGVKSAYPAASDTHSRRDSVSPETRETQRALENLSPTVPETHATVNSLSPAIPETLFRLAHVSPAIAEKLLRRSVVSPQAWEKEVLGFQLTMLVIAD